MNEKIESIMETVCELCHWCYVCDQDALDEACKACPAEKKLRELMGGTDDGKSKNGKA